MANRARWRRRPRRRRVSHTARARRTATRRSACPPRRRRSFAFASPTRWRPLCRTPPRPRPRRDVFVRRLVVLHPGVRGPLSGRRRRRRRRRARRADATPDSTRRASRGAPRGFRPVPPKDARRRAGAGGERANVESEDESVHPEASSSRRPAFSSDPNPRLAVGRPRATRVPGRRRPPPPPRTTRSGSSRRRSSRRRSSSPTRPYSPACGDAYAPDATHVSIAARRVIETRNGSERDVSVRRVLAGKNEKRKNDATARLQETLGKHLDVVETRLTNVLSSRSAQFMDAATQINQLVDAVERARVTCAGARRVAKTQTRSSQARFESWTRCTGSARTWAPSRARVTSSPSSGTRG